MDKEVERGEARVRIALATVALDGGADEGLGEDEVGEVVDGDLLGICAEELGEEAFEGEVVDVGVGVEEVEVDVDEALLAGTQVKAGGCGQVVDVRNIRGLSPTRRPTRARPVFSCPSRFPRRSGGRQNCRLDRAATALLQSPDRAGCR